MTNLDKSYIDTWSTRSKKLIDVCYSDYLKSDEWAVIRKKAFKRTNYQGCYICGTSQQLDLHHLSYKTIGTTDLRNIRSVCRTHHQTIHDYAKKHGISVRLATRKYRKIFKREQELHK